MAKGVFVTGLRGIPGVIGGVESHCEELLPRIAALDPELEITVLGRRRFLDRPESSYRGIKVVALPAPTATSLEAIGGTLAAVLHARRSGGGLLHVHAVGPSLLAPLAKLLGMRVVMTHHGRDYDRAKWGRAAKAMLRLGERLGIGAADRTIAVAPSLTDELQARYPGRADAIRFIPNGAPHLEDNVFAADVLERFGLQPRGFVMTVGRLVPEKGFDYLVRAFRRSGSPLKLAVVGSAMHDSAFSRELLREADERVLFLGNQPRAVLRRLYEQAALFVLPSFHEGLAISALEAIQCGTPMLLSDIKPNVDLGLPPHCHFPVGDDIALAVRLGEPPERFAYDASALRGRYDWDHIAAQTLQVYREALGAAAATGASSAE